MENGGELPPCPVAAITESRKTPAINMGSVLLRSPPDACGAQSLRTRVQWLGLRCKFAVTSIYGVRLRSWINSASCPDIEKFVSGCLYMNTLRHFVEGRGGLRKRRLLDKGFYVVVPLTGCRVCRGTLDRARAIYFRVSSQRKTYIHLMHALIADVTVSGVPKPVPVVNVTALTATRFGL